MIIIIKRIGAPTTRFPETIILNDVLLLIAPTAAAVACTHDKYKITKYLQYLYRRSRYL